MLLPRDGSALAAIAAALEAGAGLDAIHIVAHVNLTNVTHLVKGDFIL